MRQIKIDNERAVIHRYTIAIIQFRFVDCFVADTIYFALRDYNESY